MRRLSDTNKAIGNRFDFWIHRTVEELYDYKNDPNAMNNLIDNPEYKDMVFRLRSALEQHMIKTKDYALEAFQNREDKDFLNRWMENQLQEAKQRSETIKWKRYKNQSGPTKGNKILYSLN